jgi:formylglycine-generating enzyme required for sulfatase activity
MIVVPAGAFRMGAGDGEKSQTTAEGPPHQVTFARPFAVGRFAVTFDEWDACVADGGCGGYHPQDLAWGRGKSPVINVSWSDAKAYVAWLSAKTGKKYRLLSESEREYVTRAGTTTVFWWGNTITTDQANYNGSFGYDGGKRGQLRGKTVPVDTFAANPWGLYQVHGNVLEWLEDCFFLSYDGAPADGSAREGTACSHRATRGGSWRAGPGYLRSASRWGDIATSRSATNGFRVARTLAARSEKQ